MLPPYSFPQAATDLAPPATIMNDDTLITMNETPLDLQSNSLMQTIPPQGPILPGDIPITEIEFTTVVPRKPPTEPRILSTNPVREVLLEEPTLVGPNIHDANREKIVIRPRCKEYVEKQKQKPFSIRTLACFSTSLKSNEERHASPESHPDVEMKDATIPPVTSKAPASKISSPKAKVLAKPKTPTQPRVMCMDTKAPPGPPAPLIPRALTKPRPIILSGRIEKPPKSPSRPVQLPSLPIDASSVIAIAPYELYSCGCSAPSACQSCTLRRLVDKFCAIVTTRKELIRVRQNEKSVMCT
ncbi:hypothetical protein DFH08DRAFT_870312 [Mycena albidolilacea]|uniref:Uncharacterized protein n=1 Tax=Mycena albidolilacea TaxID=1033008 RepID=A0AAD7A1N1_9AGAR|nr:hypothetical protein DFH08DRAFT_870312 [Mycena albidolilacea]